MNESEKEAQQKMLREQIEKYSQLSSRYRLYAETLLKVLEQASKKYAPLAIVQARAKTIPSFAGKILRKSYKDPVNEITDLCGARVITHTVEEVKAVSKFIEKHFEIDWANTVDVSSRLKPTEFGYRSVHYIVKFKEAVFPTKEVNVVVPSEVFGLKAEIQVRTILEHAWADFSHDMSYKGAFKIPQKWERELAGLAAALEGSDKAFSRIHEGVQAYSSSYGSFMSEDQIRKEISTLELILDNDKDDVELADRVGRLALALGDWQKAIDVLSKYVKSDHPPVLRDLGVALCKKHREDKKSPEYLQGQKYLEAACAPPNRDVDALSSLAGTYKGVDEDRVRALYRQAFEIEPSNPYALGNYLECEIVHGKNVSVLSVAGPLIEEAIKRCRDQADVSMNLPWAFYDMGKFYLLLGKPYLSLAAYAKAVQISAADWMICTSLASIERLALVREQLPGYEWVLKLLLVGLATKFPSSSLSTTPKGKTAVERVKEMSLPGLPIRGPIVVLVGACEKSVQQQMQSYQELILKAFRDFQGTVVSGGTTAGVGKLTGELHQQYPKLIRAVGYVPKNTRKGQIDKRHSEIRRTDGKDFSLTESLQYWIDMVASGIRPSEVKVLGINGGEIAAFEYRLALALGAGVAIVHGSGGEATKLLVDSDWNSSERLVELPIDPTTVNAFIVAGVPKLEPKIRETIAKAIHENYVSVQTSSGRSQDPSLTKWDELLEYLRESNRQQADHIAEKLHRICCTIHEVKNRAIALMTFTQSEIEVMAEMEHARWNIERLLDGWKWGKTKDVTKRISPYLVSWDELPDDVKEWDRNTVRKIPEFLAMVGLEVRRNGDTKKGKKRRKWRKNVADTLSSKI